MTKPEEIAERLYAKLGRGSSADIEAIRAAILSAVEEEREACAEVARNWMHNWANDLVDTRDSYIEAKSTGKHNGRRMGREDADFYAKQFRERADAVSDCVEHVASAICNRKES